MTNGQRWSGQHTNDAHWANKVKSPTHNNQWQRSTDDETMQVWHVLWILLKGIGHNGLIMYNCIYLTGLPWSTLWVCYEVKLIFKYYEFCSRCCRPPIPTWFFHLQRQTNNDIAGGMKSYWWCRWTCRCRPLVQRPLGCHSNRRCSHNTCQSQQPSSEEDRFEAELSLRIRSSPVSALDVIPDPSRSDDLAQAWEPGRGATLTTSSRKAEFPRSFAKTPIGIASP